MQNKKNILIEQKALGDALISLFWYRKKFGKSPDLVLCNDYNKWIFSNCNCEVLPFPVRKDQLKVKNILFFLKGLLKRRGNNNYHAYSPSKYEWMLSRALFPNKKLHKYHDQYGTCRTDNIYINFGYSQSIAKGIKEFRPLKNKALIIKDAGAKEKEISHDQLLYLGSLYESLIITTFPELMQGYELSENGLIQLSEKIRVTYSGYDIICTDSFCAHFLFLVVSAENVFVVFNTNNFDVWCPPSFTPIRIPKTC